MEEKIISQGAEAVIKLLGDRIIKERLKKSYRIKELDEKLRKSRTKKEKKILEKAAEIINVPRVFPNKDDFVILMEFIEGKKISDCLDEFDNKKQEEIMESVGKMVALLHEKDIIHGDLTTSNMIKKGKDIFFIDFGLSFISKRVEDMAVDLHLLRQALEARHWRNYENLFSAFVRGYKKNYHEAEVVLERLKKVEKRGRYKH